MTCSERDIIVTVHSNGNIEWRACKIMEDEKGKTTLNYELLYSGETQRITHHCRISAAALCPITQTTVALLYNSGNISIYQLVGRFFFPVYVRNNFSLENTFPWKFQQQQ